MMFGVRDNLWSLIESSEVREFSKAGVEAQFSYSAGGDLNDELHQALWSRTSDFEGVGGDRTCLSLSSINLPISKTAKRQ